MYIKSLVNGGEKVKGAIGDKITEAAGVPKETIMDLTKLSFAENRELYIENHKGITEYSEDVIKIKTKYSVIKICGANFRISYINKFDLLLEGVFYSITFEH